MKLIDTIYYVSHRAYVKGNKTEAGALLACVLWFSGLQFMIFMSLLIAIEVLAFKKLADLDNVFIFSGIYSVILVLNTLYLLIGNRKERILNRETLSKKRQLLYWILIIISFIISLILFGIMAAARKNVFG